MVESFNKLNNFTQKGETKDCARLFCHCPKSLSIQKEGNDTCTEVSPIAWGHQGCPGGWGEDYIDGKGKVHCNCSGPGFPRCFFDLRFQCGQSRESHSYSNFLDARSSFITIKLSLLKSDQDLDSDQEDALDEGVNQMINNLKQRAKDLNLKKKP